MSGYGARLDVAMQDLLPCLFEAGLCEPLAECLKARHTATTTILGSFQGPSQISNETLCVLNHRRRLTLPRLTAAPTATSSTYV